MDIKKALEIKKAIITLSDYLGMTPQEVARNICFLDKIRGGKMIEASNAWNKFDNADIVSKGKMLGLTIEFK